MKIPPPQFEELVAPLPPDGFTCSCNANLFILLQVALFFMDVEGFHDPKKNSNCFNYKLFTICSLLSGCHMYNVCKQLKDEHLDEILVRQLQIIDEQTFSLLKSF